MNPSMYEEQYKVQSKHWWFVAKKEIIIDHFCRNIKNLNNENLKILDAGCGPGLMLSELQKFGETSGMDYSDDAIKFSSKIFSGTLKKCNLPTLVPFADNTFDALIALDVVEHIDDDVSALKVFSNLLKKDGVAILTVPAYMFLWSEHDEINHHKRRYTLTEFEQKINKANLKIVNITYYNTLLFPVIFLVRFVNKVLGRRSESDVQLPSRFVNWALCKTFLLERFLLKYLKFPFGVSILAVVKKS